MSASTQLVVIGAGPGGYAAAFYAADRGMKVTLVDPSPNPGGVCLYRGCIPSKALLHVAKVVNEAKHASAWGVTFAAPAIEIDKVRAFKDKVVTQLTGGVGQVAKLRKIDYIQGTAAFRDARSLDITKADGTTSTLAFAHAVIATGSRPTTVPGAVDRRPARDGLDGGARHARRAEVAARGRRRLHRARARERLRRARIESHRRRDDRRPAAGCGPRPRQHPRQADQRDLRGRAAQYEGCFGQGSQGRRHRHVRGAAA